MHIHQSEHSGVHPSADVIDKELHAIADNVLPPIQREGVAGPSLSGVFSFIHRSFMGQTHSARVIDKLHVLQSAEKEVKNVDLKTMNDLELRVKAISTESSLLNAKIALVKALKELLDEKSNQPHLKLAELKARLNNLEIKYCLDSENLQVRTTEYSASAEIFRIIMGKRPLPHPSTMPQLLPLQIESSLTDSQALHVKKLEKELEIAKKTIELKRHPDTNLTLTDSDIHSLNQEIEKIQLHLTIERGKIAGKEFGNSTAAHPVNDRQVECQIMQWQADCDATRLQTQEQYFEEQKQFSAPEYQERILKLTSKSNSIKKLLVRGLTEKENNPLNQGQRIEMQILQQEIDLQILNLREKQIDHIATYKTKQARAVITLINTFHNAIKDPRIAERLKIHYQRAVNKTLEESNSLQKDALFQNNERDSLRGEIQTLKSAIKADKSVFSKLTPYTFKIKGSLQRLGNYLSAAIDNEDISRLLIGKHARVKQPENYKWQNSKWGQLLINFEYAPLEDAYNDFTKFKEGIDARKTAIRDLVAELSAKENALKELHLQRTTDAIVSRGITSAPALVAEQTRLDTLIHSFETELQELHEDINDNRIMMRSAYMQRITHAIGLRQRGRNQLATAIAQINQNITDLGDNPATQKAKQEFQLQVDRHEEQRTCLMEEIDELKKAFKKQLWQYEKLDQPQRSNVLVGVLRSKDIHGAAKSMAKGYFLPKYVTPREFTIKMQFAEKGYHWKDALKQLGDRLKDPLAIAKFNRDFIEWINNHPTSAEALSADMAITLSRLGQQEILATLQAGVRAKLYTHAILGESTRSSMAEPIITENDFAFYALAEIVQWGPLSSSLIDVLRAFGSNLQEGKIVKAFVSATVEGLTSATKSAAIQSVVHGLDYSSLQALNTVIAVTRGQGAEAILAEQQALSLLKTYGDTKQALLHPRTWFQETWRWVKDSFKIIKNSKGLEKFARMCSSYAVPTIGVLGAVVAIVFTGGIVGIGAAIGWGLLSLFTSTSIAASGTYICNIIWPVNYQHLQRENVKELLEQNGNRQKLHSDRTRYLESLRKKGFILPEFKKIPPEEEPEPIRNWLLYSTVSNPIFELRAEMIKSFQDYISTLVKQRKGEEFLSSEDITRAYLNSTNDLKAKCLAACKKKSYWNKELLAKRLEEHVLAPLLQLPTKTQASGELVKWLDRAFENQFCTMVMKYKTPEQWEDDQKQRGKSLQEKWKTLENTFSNKLTDAAVVGTDRSDITARFAASWQDVATC
ncbi:MAG: hypothetical protein JWO53_494 [Chlamydiia bacterium]|nr:hypothetical protein [Chlamydiia bacterium]